MFTLVRYGALFVWLAACSASFGLEQPILEQPDAAVDTRGATPDASSPDALFTCPDAPAGCTAFRCGVTSSCYYACDGTASFTAAQSYCAQIGGPNGSACLATINSDFEQDCVAAATTPSGGSPVWIGLYQIDGAHEPDSGWVWSCGESALERWGAFEPYDLVGDHDCGELASGGAWKSDVCSYDRRFVCELAIE